MEQFFLEFELAPQRRIFSVTELTAAVRALLSGEFADIWVSGEISGMKLASSGHYYFTLKDRDAQLRAVAFRSAHRFWKFKPQDGLAVLARGRIDVFESRGEYQLQVELLEPQGLGALQLAFEQLKKKLAAEGLFATGRKRPLPRFPRRIGIVTSARGAAIADMVQILTTRLPGLHIRLFPALVQGEGSVEEVCRGIEYFSRTMWPDVVIVGRGGGSLEDLWTFNEEAVARAIAACAVPVVSAVGHETDVTIADFVADLRAPTPSAAAQMVVCTLQDLLERIDAGRAKLAQLLRYRFAMLERRLRQQGIERALGVLHRRVGRGMQRIDEQDYRMRERMRAALDARTRRRALEARLRRFDVRPRLAGDRRRMEAAHAAALQLVRARLARRRSALDQLAAKLSQLSPLRILERGYAIVSNQTGIVTDAADAPDASEIHVRLARGALDAGRDGVHQPLLWPKVLHIALPRAPRRPGPVPPGCSRLPAAKPRALPVAGGDPHNHAREVGEIRIGQGEAAQRIADAGIETGGDQDQLRAKTFGGRQQRILHRAQDFAPPRTRRQGEVHGGARACARAGFVPAAGARIERPLVRAEKEHRRIGVEDVLRAVAVVHVPIHDQDARYAVFALRVARGEGHVIEEAEAHAAASAGVVSRRPHGAERVLHVAGHHRVDGVQHAACGQCRDVPGIWRNVGIACAEVGPPGFDIAPRGAQVLRGVAEQKLVFSGRARVHGHQAREQAGAAQPLHNGIESLRPFRMFHPQKVLSKPRIRHQPCLIHTPLRWPYKSTCRRGLKRKPSCLQISASQTERSRSTSRSVPSGIRMTFARGALKAATSSPTSSRSCGAAITNLS